MDQGELETVCKLLLYRLGGHMMIVKADVQGIKGKKLAVTGTLGKSVTLELVDEADAEE
jgi:hypothetical protein